MGEILESGIHPAQSCDHRKLMLLVEPGGVQRRPFTESGGLGTQWASLVTTPTTTLWGLTLPP